MAHLLLFFLPACLQYSQKEDKYEEEIKILTDKLKEVSSRTFSIVTCRGFFFCFVF